MKQPAKQKLPRGWTEKKIRAVIAHYDQQTDEEAAGEIESAAEAPGETWMSVPTELVSAVTRLIEEHEKDANGSSRNAKKKTRPEKVRTRR
jgi:hypothetical protein